MSNVMEQIMDRVNKDQLAREEPSIPQQIEMVQESIQLMTATLSNLVDVTGKMLKALVRMEGQDCIGSVSNAALYEAKGAEVVETIRAAVAVWQTSASGSVLGKASEKYLLSLFQEE